MKSKVFKRGDFIIRENETATDMIFIILHGWVKITRTQFKNPALINEEQIETK